MDSVLWRVFLINLATPSFPFIFPMRVVITGAAAESSPWWVVLIVANVAGALGMLPVYGLARWWASDEWQTRVAQFASLDRLRHRFRSNMFLLQVGLNATPLPDFVSSGLAGCERYPIWRFLIAQVLGRTFHNLPVIIGVSLLDRLPWFHQLLQYCQHPISWIVVAGVAFAWWLVQRRPSQPPPP